ncbi:tyrosine phosphatase family-domain-containing protein [Xylaria sp. CBS 124048]|nr:tyrosine phosphatase family-domain-containing protein [Xylaria sp. CBS 124048]
MEDNNDVTDQASMANTGSRTMVTTPEPYDETSSQSCEVASGQNILANDSGRESQTCTKRLTPGRSMPSPHHPINFAMVSEGLYRSGYPQPRDYPFMQTLKLKTIVTLVNKELPEGFQQFIKDNGITHKIFDMSGTKKEAISTELMRSIYAVISKPENYPLLVHCNHGKHRTGCVVGVYRLSNHWDMKRIVDEYTAFAEPKVRETDLQYLAQFEIKSLSRQPPPESEVTRVSCARFVRIVVMVAFAIFAIIPLAGLKMQETI